MEEGTCPCAGGDPDVWDGGDGVGGSGYRERNKQSIYK